MKRSLKEKVVYGFLALCTATCLALALVYIGIEILHLAWGMG